MLQYYALWNGVEKARNPAVLSTTPDIESDFNSFGKQQCRKRKSEKQKSTKTLAEKSRRYISGAGTFFGQGGLKIVRSC